MRRYLLLPLPFSLLSCSDSEGDVSLTTSTQALYAQNCRIVEKADDEALENQWRETAGRYGLSSVNAFAESIDPYASRSGGEFDREQGKASFRGSQFRNLNGGGNPKHIVVYYTKGKHHDYADAGRSGSADASCLTITARIDSRGHLHNPSFPMREAHLRTPYCPGGNIKVRDRFGYNNVGSKAHQYFDSLMPYGYEGERVWNDKHFYDANSVDRNFE